jgi:NarL family two-component system response regulator LiaR
MTDLIRIFIADNHAIVREGLRALLATEPDLELVGEASDGLHAVSKVRGLRPDVILIDMLMPRMDGLEAILEIRKDWPEAKIIVLTSFSDDEKVFSAIRNGALGYLLKESSPQDLLQAIHSVARGEGFLSPTIASKVMRELNQPPKLPPTKDPLTEREVEILQLVAQGLTNDEIAEKLVVSERTVRTHVSNILAKLQLANRTQAALYALKEGLASL